MKALIFGTVFRHFLGGIGASLITAGVMSDGQWQAISGGVLALVAVATGVYNKVRLSREQ